MRRLRLTIAYDGTNYCGWQSQKSEPTIQDTLEAALARILNHPGRVVGSGRTDSGVHALGQVAHFDTQSSIALSALQRGMNSLLPPDICVGEIDAVDTEFHARFSAKSRRYEYHIWNDPQPSVFRRCYSWWIREELDVARMETAARLMLGRHDFASFQGTDDTIVSSVRLMMEVDFEKSEAEIVFSVRASAFLRHMVRNIVGTLVEVGKKKITPDDFARILQARDRSRAGITAPPQGLFLARVYY